MNNWLKKMWKDNKSLLVFLSLMLVFRSAVADWNEVPTGSMKPTIVEGDRIFINKMAYDVRIPFTHVSLIKMSDPQHNDIIIFDSVVSDKRLVKRVIGLPGDIISMENNRVSINGKQLSYQQVAINGSVIDIEENLSGNTHTVRTNSAGSQLSNFSEVKVPRGHYLVLGDNRDDSADSRVIGFVPRDEIIGRSSSVVMSLDYDNYYIPRADRFFQEL
ncbi:MAG: signal peptidase I [Alteromonadaceae bacterium]|nr:signal peptidase I [Alteromonadaceae bacterium]